MRLLQYTTTVAAVIFLTPALAAPLSLTQAFALAQTNDAAYDVSQYDRDMRGDFNFNDECG